MGVAMALWLANQRLWVKSSTVPRNEELEARRSKSRRIKTGHLEEHYTRRKSDFMSSK